MIKRANNKKKKGFTLIELIIVLAVMAIIALIAIPNFSAVRDNSKNKADEQSRATIERTVLMLVSDETVTVTETTSGTPVSFETTFDTTSKKVNGVDKETGGSISKGKTELVDALKEVKEPQGKDKSKYKITIGADGSVKAETVK